MAPPDAGVAAVLDELLGGRRGLRKGKMFGCPAYFLGTKAVACVFEDALNLTLPPAKIDELVKTPGFRKFEPRRGRTMTGWVLIEQERLATLEASDELFEDAIAYARAKGASAPKR
jgi:hypothetical protein